MADLILGEPTNFTVMSAGVLGNQRVTFAPWELDWEWFDSINLIFHFIANTTVGNAFPVTAKGGSERQGYWFEVDTPAGAWASGQRCTPQRQVGIFQFATFFAATLAMANDDVFLVWYADATNRRTWYERILWVDEGGSARGMLSRQQIELAPSGDDLECVFNGGNLSVMANATEIVNFGMAATGENTIRYAPLNGQPIQGPGLIVRRCRIHAGVNGIYIDRCNAGSCIIGDCVFTGCVVGILLPADAAEVYVYYNLATDCQEGYHLVPADTECRDCVASECGVGFAATPGGAAALNCATTDGSLTAGPTNLLNQDARVNLQFFHDLARPGDKSFDFDFRTHFDTVLRGRGVATGYAPLAWDMDGVLRPGPPSIGPYEPMSTAYAPGAEMVRGTVKKGVYP